MAVIEEALVFIHGIKGGQLATTDGQIKWLTFMQAINPCSKASFALPLNYNDEGVQDQDCLVTSGTLESINICVSRYNIYKKCLDGLRQSCEETGQPFYDFSYDWRRELNESVDAFEIFLDKIRQDHKVQVIAHSMGGLITLSLLLRRSDLFHSVVFVGVPFKPELGFLPDMTKGVSAGLNRSLLSAQAHFTWPSTYTLFPLGANNKYLLDENNKEIAADFMNPDDWIKYSLGIFNRDQTKYPFTVQECKHLHLSLKKAKSFRENLLKHDENQKYPPIATLSGIGRPTLTHVDRFPAKNGLHKFSFNGAFSDGDGRVTTLSSTSLPHGLGPVRNYYTNYSHGDLANDTALLQRILTNLRVGVEEIEEINCSEKKLAAYLS